MKFSCLNKEIFNDFIKNLFKIFFNVFLFKFEFFNINDFNLEIINNFLHVS
jgi:hypothetical protein